MSYAQLAQQSDHWGVCEVSRDRVKMEAALIAQLRSLTPSPAEWNDRLQLWVVPGVAPARSDDQVTVDVGVKRHRDGGYVGSSAGTGSRAAESALAAVATPSSHRYQPTRPAGSSGTRGDAVVSAPLVPGPLQYSRGRVDR